MDDETGCVGGSDFISDTGTIEFERVPSFFEER